MAKVLEFPHQSFQWIFRIYFLEGWLVWSLFSPRDSQESFPMPQLKSIKSSTLNFLYGIALPSIRDYWKKHSFDYTDLCWTFGLFHIFAITNSNAMSNLVPVLLYTCVNVTSIRCICRCEITGFNILFGGITKNWCFWIVVLEKTH